MKRRHGGLSAFFFILIWVIFFSALIYDAYKEFNSGIGILDIQIKSLDEIVNGNPKVP